MPTFLKKPYQKLQNKPSGALEDVVIDKWFINNSKTLDKPRSKKMKTLLLGCMILFMSACGKQSDDDGVAEMPNPDDAVSTKRAATEESAEASIVGHWNYEISYYEGNFMMFESDGTCSTGSIRVVGKTAYTQGNACIYEISNDVLSITFLKSSKPDKGVYADINFEVTESHLKVMDATGLIVFEKVDLDTTEDVSMSIIYGYFDIDGTFFEHAIVDLGAY